jgi:hypothetical protein
MPRSLALANPIRLARIVKLLRTQDRIRRELLANPIRLARMVKLTGR